MTNDAKVNDKTIDRALIADVVRKVIARLQQTTTTNIDARLITLETIERHDAGQRGVRPGRSGPVEPGHPWRGDHDTDDAGDQRAAHLELNIRQRHDVGDEQPTAEHGTDADRRERRPSAAGDHRHHERRQYEEQRAGLDGRPDRLGKGGQHPPASARSACTAASVWA